MPGDEDDLRGIGRNRDPLREVDSGEPGQMDVGDHAAATAALLGGEKGLRALEARRPIAGGAQQIAQRFPHDGIVVDNANKALSFHGPHGGRFRRGRLLSHGRGLSCSFGQVGGPAVSASPDAPPSASSP